MRVNNVHERLLQASPAVVGALIDTLASSDDRLWPVHAWPPIRFDRPLCVGAIGGHGPIRYRIVSYVPGQSIRFNFLEPEGFAGFHELIATPRGSRTLLRHSLQMRTLGWARLSWPLIYRPLHDALIEDALARAQSSLQIRPDIRSWTVTVRMLRSLLSARRKRPR